MKKRKKQNSKFVRNMMTVFFLLLAGVFAVLAGTKAVHTSVPAAVNESGGESAVPESLHANEVETSALPQQPQDTAPAAGEKVIYLTFDDGPTDNTTKIMDALDSVGVKGTFFVVHSYDGCEKQIKEIHDRGHQIALHSYTHLYSIYRSQEAYFEDLGKISDLVYTATGGYRCKLVRFPGGSSNTISRKYCPGIMTTLTKELPKRGYAYFDWNADSMDATGKTVSVEKIVRNSKAYIGQMDKIILLMHDANLKTTTVDALPEIVRAYQDAGYRFDVLSTKSFTVHHTVNN